MQREGNAYSLSAGRDPDGHLSKQQWSNNSQLPNINRKLYGQRKKSSDTLSQNSQRLPSKVQQKFESIYGKKVDPTMRDQYAQQRSNNSQSVPIHKRHSRGQGYDERQNHNFPLNHYQMQQLSGRQYDSRHSSDRRSNLSSAQMT